MEGYDHLSSHMAKYPDLAIFRKFSILNNRVLLYLQAELTRQEHRLILAIKDDSGEEGRRQFACNFDAMFNAQDGTRDAGVQKHIMDEIRSLVKEYSRCSHIPAALSASADFVCVLKTRCFCRTTILTVSHPFTHRILSVFGAS